MSASLLGVVAIRRFYLSPGLAVGGENKAIVISETDAT